FPEFDRIVLTAPGNPRAVRPELLEAEWRAHDPVITQATAEAVQYVREHAAPEDVVVITGSLFVVGEARPCFVK
ncbi:MAG TPA: bifunctional folylpolyglutamate synthase/dihydrofolate synthase, partial [Bryobacteraceae bacterium]|nr:bifunctional folylpolyglutamate synthase/dihydrofolate synthase [Bryobacteraceae bacterium]